MRTIIVTLLFVCKCSALMNTTLFMGALESFYNATNGINWHFKPVNTEFRKWNFSDANSVCSWQGICCSNNYGKIQNSVSCNDLARNDTIFPSKISREVEIGLLESSFVANSIIGISLQEYGLFGSLPPIFFEISTISILTLPSNRITGTIPPEISNMRRLQLLELSGNRLIGTCPSTMVHLGYLLSIDISSNQNLHGMIPDQIGMLTNLLLIDFSNNFFSQNMPSSLGNLSSLVYLNLSKNQFIGTVPYLGELHKLEFLSCGRNHLHGSIPHELANLPKLNYVELYDNSFSGSLCNDFILPNCSVLSLQNNSLTGRLPVTINLWLQLEQLCLFQNNFIGTIPSNLAMLPKINGIWLHVNALTGTLPSELFSLKNLSNGLYLGNNKLHGTIPNVIGQMDGLVFLSLANNLLTGTLPNELHMLHALTGLLLQNNALRGSLDNKFSRLQANLTTIQLSSNNFTGTLPEVFFQLPALQHLIIVENCMSGSISNDICNISTLAVLALNGMNTAPYCRFNITNGGYMPKHFIIGTIPGCLFSMPHIGTLHLAGNELFGILPSDASISGSLQNLSLSHNRLSGTIPLAFQRRTAGQFQLLDLSFNRFGGEIAQMGDFFTPTIANFTAFMDDDATQATAVNYELNLEVNNLSGNLPNSFWKHQIGQMNVVRGNLFYCAMMSKLPPGDPGSASTSCGSGYLDIALMMGLIVLGFSIVLTLVVFVLPKLKTQSVQALVNEPQNAWSSLMRETSVQGTAPPLSSLQTVAHAPPSTSSLEIQPSKLDNQPANTEPELVKLTVSLRKYILKCIGISREVACWAIVWEPPRSNHELCEMPFTLEFIQFAKTMNYLAVRTCLYILPFCLLLEILFKSVGHHSYSTHIHQYWFLPSLMYIKGFLPAGITLVMTILLGSALHRTIKRNYDHYARFRPPSAIVINSKNWRKKLAVIMIVSSCNMILMGACNVFYLIFALGFETSKISVDYLGALLGLVKVMWNMFLLPMSVHELIARVVPEQADSTMPTGLLTSLMITNNIFIPILVIMATDPNCAKFLFNSQPAVTFSFSFISCTAYFQNTCKSYGPTVEVISYGPPFIYSYQCSSSLLRYYTPVFVAMYGFFIILSLILVWVVPYVFSQLNSKSNPALKSFIKYIQSPITQSTAQHLDDLKSNRILLAADESSASLISNFAMLLTFGVGYPILGFVIGIVMWVNVMQHRYLIGRYLSKCEKVDPEARVVMRKKLELACSGLSFVLDKFKGVFIVTMTLFYVIFVLDMTGSTRNVNWRVALPLPVLMLVWPLALNVFDAIHIHGTNLFVPISKAAKTMRVSSITRGVSLARFSSRTSRGSAREEDELSLSAARETTASTASLPATKVYYETYNSNFVNEEIHPL